MSSLPYSYYPYESVFGRPSGPYAAIELITPDATSVFQLRRFSCFGLLDTGSQVTFVPESILSRLGLQPYSQPRSSIGIGGKASYSPYIVSIEMEEQRVPNFPVLAWEKEIALVGRDVLAEFHVCFDGIGNRFNFVVNS